MRAIASRFRDHRPRFARGLAAAFACLALVSLPSGTGAADSFWSASVSGAEALLSTMTPEERIAQLLMLSYRGPAPDEALLSLVRTRGLGGVKIFGWNADSSYAVADAVRALQTAATRSRHSIPLLVATDQEGGWIRHVKGRTTVTPGNMALGASGRPWDAYWSGYYIARELKALGVNMNFAPTVDLATELDSFIIGPRAFSESPVATGTLAIAFYRGTRDAGVIATAKHFPGHGATALDSHGALPRIMADYETIWNRELVPYRMLVSEGLPAIMSGHLSFPLVEKAALPASLSRHFLDEILRRKLGFRGIVVTDDVNMHGAISAAGSIPETVYRSIMAGNDVVEMSIDVREGDATWNRLLSAYRTEPAFRARVDESALRVLHAKLEYLASGGPSGVMPVDDLDARVPDPEGASFFFDMACRSATVVTGRGLPLARDSRVLLAGQFPRFFSAGRASFPDAAEFRFAYGAASSSGGPDPAALKAAAAGRDAIVICVADSRSRALLASLKGSRVPVFVVSVLSPVLIRDAAWVAGSVAVYSYADASIDAAFAVLRGDIEGHGRLPVTLE